MKIGDVAAATGVPARMIRYYEAQGLLEPTRGVNGYRLYGDAEVARVRRIRNHIAAGLPTRLIKAILDMEKPDWSEKCDADFAAALKSELSGLDERIACLTSSRQAISDVLRSVDTSLADTR